MSLITRFLSPLAPGAKGEESDAEDEEGDEGDDAHLWGWKPTQHANHPYWSHCVSAL